MSKKLVLIDGHSILNRAFYGIPDLTNAEGLHTNAVYGFLNILFKILDEEKPDYLTVAFDVHAPTFRHKMYDAYKGTRKPMAEELRQQVPLMKEMLQAMGVRIIEKEGYEADDIIGTIAKRSEKEGLVVSVVSGDRDLLQLATDHIKIRIPKDETHRNRDRGLQCGGCQGALPGHTGSVHRCQGIDGGYGGQYSGCPGHWREDGDQSDRSLWKHRGSLRAWMR